MADTTETGGSAETAEAVKKEETAPVADVNERREAPASGLATFFPGYFALVMATGIIATGAHLEGLDWLGDGLFAIAAVAYVLIAALMTMRVIRYPRLVLADLTSHARGFAFLTAVAATNVLGAAAGVVQGWWGLAWALWFVGVAAWPILLYITLVAVVLGGPKPGLEAGINGTWFLLTVATASIAVLGALLLRRGDSDVLAFTCLALFCLGLVLYLIVMTMVFLRWTFASLEPTEADPPAWIAAGAVAIVVLAGSNLLLAQDAAPRIARVAPAIEAVVVLAWATATFWFPLMVAIGVWRHIIRRLPLRYHPSYWALVFPLGMYGVATSRMAEATDLAALDWLPPVVLGIALTAWALAFAGLVGTASRVWRSSPVAASGRR
jgi:tellurite resistance protein TehA-like permease